MITAVSALSAQTKNAKLFTLDGTDIGGYVGMNTRYTTINSLGAGLLDFRAAVVINGKWAIGYNTTGLLNDRHLNKLDPEEVYHLMGGYQGIYLERIFRFSEDFKCSLSIMIGEGTVKYRYCRSEIADKKWYEETIDEAEFYILAPTFDIYYNPWDHLWIGLNTGYNMTTSIRMMDTDENLLNKFNAGLSLKYGPF
jgi:hypothetical protein